DRAQHPVHRIRENTDTVVKYFARDLVEGDAELLEGFHDLPSPQEVLLEAGAKLPVIAKSIHRGQRHRIDRGGADQLLDIKHVAVFRIFGSGACPKQALRPSALRAQRLPSRPGEEALISFVGELGVSDRYLASDARQGAVLCVVARLTEPRVNELVDGCINAADKETGDTGDPAGIT